MLAHLVAALAPPVPPPAPAPPSTPWGEGDLLAAGDESGPSGSVGADSPDVLVALDGQPTDPPAALPAPIAEPAAPVEVLGGDGHPELTRDVAVVVQESVPVSPPPIDQPVATPSLNGVVVTESAEGEAEGAEAGEATAPDHRRPPTTVGGNTPMPQGAEARAALLGVVPMAIGVADRGTELPTQGIPRPALEIPSQGTPRPALEIPSQGTPRPALEIPPAHGKVATLSGSQLPAAVEPEGAAGLVLEDGVQPPAEAVRTAAVALLLRDLLESPTHGAGIGQAKNALHAALADGNMVRTPRGVPQVLAGALKLEGNPVAATMMAAPAVANGSVAPMEGIRPAPLAPAAPPIDTAPTDVQPVPLPDLEAAPVPVGPGGNRTTQGDSGRRETPEHQGAEGDAASAPAVSRVATQPATIVPAMAPLSQAPLPSRGAAPTPGVASAPPAAPPAPLQPGSQVTVLLDSAVAGANRIRVALRGDVVHATIVADVAAAVALTQRLPELQRSLRDRGFSDAQLSVRVLGAEGVAAPPAIRTESTATASGHTDARPESDPRHGQRRADPDGRQRQHHRHPEPEESA